MTKIGEGGIPPQPSPELYQKNLQNQLNRFEHHLDAYQMASNPQEREELKAVMDEQLKAIQGAVREIKRAGIEKQTEKVQGDFNKFSKNPTDANYTALQQDLSTLKEYSELPLDR